MEVEETSELDAHQGKLQNNLAFCTHPDVRGFRGQICIYMRERDQKSCMASLACF